MNILAYLIIGASYGLVLFLIATGMTLTMGLMRVVNMSHGAVYMVSGYTGVWVYQVTRAAHPNGSNLPWWLLSILVGALVGALLGAVMEMGFLKRLYKYPTYQVLLTIGFINILNNVAEWIWGGLPMSAPVADILRGSIPIGGIPVPKVRFFILAFGIVLAVLLWFLQDKTRLGSMVRAGMDNQEIASTLGINNKLIFTGVFVLGSLVAGLSSIIGGGITGLSSGSTSWNVLLNSIIVVVVGGTGSIQGALLGGVILGEFNAFAVGYLDKWIPGASSYVFYVVLIIVLLVKPAGLLGKKVDMNKAIEADLDKTTSPKKHKAVLPTAEVVLNDLRVSPKLKAYRWAPYVIVALLLVFVPAFTGDYLRSMMSKVLIYALFAMSLDLMMGYGGRRSFGHAAYFGMGGYMIGFLTRKSATGGSDGLGFGLNFWVAVVITLLVCAILAAIISYLTLKLSGTYFLIVTMAFGQLLSVMATQMGGSFVKNITNGTDGLSGIPTPNLGFVKLSGPFQLYYFVLVVFIICYILLHLFMRSSYGRSIIGIRENEGRMRALGYNTWSSMYVTAIIAGVFGGVAGMLYGLTYNVVTPTMFDLTSSAMPMLMVILGGGATLWGPALGAFIIIMFQTFTSIKFPDRWPLLLGLLYVVCVLFLRGGIAQYLTNLWNWVGSLIFPKGKGAAQPAAQANKGGS